MPAELPPDEHDDDLDELEMDIPDDASSLVEESIEQSRRKHPSTGWVFDN